MGDMIVIVTILPRHNTIIVMDFRMTRTTGCSVLPVMAMPTGGTRTNGIEISQTDIAMGLFGHQDRMIVTTVIIKAADNIMEKRLGTTTNDAVTAEARLEGGGPGVGAAVHPLEIDASDVTTTIIDITTMIVDMTTIVVVVTTMTDIVQTTEKVAKTVTETKIVVKKTTVIVEIQISSTEIAEVLQ